jgi:DNA (cytosine-5)-methyltransferase 1
MNYYNEYDPKAAAWLRELIRAGEIPAGDVDERSITEISPHELTRYTQHHFFAGIGGWPLALRLAGWPDDRPVRTGSCPCQPFSAAGKQLGTADARHLWPVFRDLIAFGEPATTFGEQVASALGREWLAGVRADMEGVGYAVGAADLCAASAGAPHIRQRLYWVADPVRSRSLPAAHAGIHRREKSTGPRNGQPLGSCDARAVANTDGGHASAEGIQRSGQHGQRTEDGGAVRMGDADDARPQGRIEHRHRGNEWAAWSSGVVLPCTDGKARRIEPSAFPLAHGIPGRVGLLRGYGNAIVPQVAAFFVTAYLEATEPANVVTAARWRALPNVQGETRAEDRL